MPERLPAKRNRSVQPALPDLGGVEADHFDEWRSEAVDAWLTEVLPRFVPEERMVEGYRQAIGLALHRLLLDYGEAGYAERVRVYAAAAGVTAATLGRWRSAAEKALKLPPPSPRTVAQRQRREGDALTRGRRVSAIDVRSTPSPAEQIAAAPVEGPPVLPAPPKRARPAPRKEVREGTWDPCPRCSNCPKCDGTGQVFMPAMRPFGR